MNPTRQTMRQAILAARDFRLRPVPVPEWGFETGLFVRSLNILDAIAFDAANKEVDPAKTSSLYLAFTLCDDSGEPIFDPANDLEDLCKKDPDVLSRLFGEALQVNENGDGGENEPGGKS